MVAARALPPNPPSLPAEPEQRFLMHGVSWKTYMLLREALDIPSLRMTYSQGALEFMSPSPEHERIKKMVARLVEMYAGETDAPLYGYGSTTFRRELKQRGLEPDECYCVGADLAQYPDIAIEVVVTSGGLDKLPIYESMGVAEVWFWADDQDAFQLFGLTEGRPADGGRTERSYEPIAKSRLLPDLDFALLTRFVKRTDQPAAIKEYRGLLRGAP